MDGITDVSKDAPPPLLSTLSLLSLFYPSMLVTQGEISSESQVSITQAISALLFSIISVISSILFTILLALELRRLGRRHLVVGISIRLLKEE